MAAGTTVGERRIKEELILTLAPNVTLELVRVPAVDDGRENQEDRNALRVLRGGSAYYFQGYLRCAFRIKKVWNDRGGGIGFRIVALPTSLASEL